MKKLTAIFAFIICVALLASCAADGTKASGGYKNAAKGFCNFLVYNVEDIRGFAPDSFWSYMSETEGYDINAEGAEENVAAYIADMRAGFVSSYGEDYRISYKITEDKELVDTSYEEKWAFFEETYGISRESVGEMRRLSLEFTIKGELDEMTNTVDVLTVEIDGKWYPCATSGYFFVHPYVSAAVAY